MIWRDILAQAHLFLVAIFCGIYLVESVVEFYPYFGKYQDRERLIGTIRIHYWVDLIVELPIAIGIGLTGIALVIMTESLSTLQIVKIALGGAFLTVGITCIREVVLRYRALQANAPGAQLVTHSRRVIQIAAAILVLCFLPALGLGLWLALAQRV